MLKSQKIESKGRLLKWLMNLTILFSLFAFSGYVADNRICQQSPRQTELIVSTSINNKRTVTFKRLLTESRVIASYSSNWTYKVNASLLQYERLIKTKLDNNSKWLVSFKKPVKILKTKYTPRNADEIISNYSRG